LARCEAGPKCASPDTDRMTFVDSHQAEFANHGICARSPDDPVFDRECFSPEGNSFEPDLVASANSPLVCSLRPNEFRPYAPRARWIRTANDSYFTAMTYPRGLSSTMQPSNIHDATWGAMSAVYGGAFHPSAEGAPLADARCRRSARRYLPRRPGSRSRCPPGKRRRIAAVARGELLPQADDDVVPECQLLVRIDSGASATSARPRGSRTGSA
jgi:hypothetical protein